MTRAVSFSAGRAAIIVALSVEQASLRRLALAGAGDVSITQSGPGPARAADNARAALAAGANALVSWGLAGGVHARLGSGTVVVPRRVRGDDGAVYPTHRAWRSGVADSLRGELGVDDGDLLTVAEPLATPAAKSAAAALGVVAVDMESAAVAAVAARARVPFIALRVVVDTAADVLPPAAVAWVDARGDRRFGAAFAAAVKPLQWRALFVLAKRYRAASRALDRAAALTAASRVLAAPAAAG
ncbi:MAG TPA: purine and other phosphorylase-like protein, family 1 [Gammaproteobacteria bacterium]|nr:purine and other phosphorylase-like protein, family 1 [Gammaproteobacteria bacterium]